MKLQELINKPQLETHEALFVLEEYIRIRKGRTIKAAPPANPIQVQLMAHMSTKAVAWLLANPNDLR